MDSPFSLRRFAPNVASTSRSAQAVYDSILARSAQAAGFTFDGNKREPRSSDGKSLEENGDVLGDTIDETMVLLW